MTSPGISIAVISPQDAGAANVIGMLRNVSDFRVETVGTSLSSVNGKAVDLRKSHDLIIFRTEGDGETDVAAIRELRARADRGATLLALCDSKMTLADIHRLTRAGVHEILPDTISAQDLEEIVRSATVHSTPARDASTRQMGHVVAIAQARGGIGATTLAVNLADQLLGRTGRFRKSNRHTVALVDLDMQFGAIGSFLDIAPNPALFTMAMDGTVPDSTFLEQSMVRTPSGLSVLTAPAGFAPLNALQKPQIEALIRTLQSEFDYVVVDLPRALVEWVSPVIQRSDRLVMVTDSSVSAVQQARRLIDFYTEDNLGLQVEVVINHEKKPLIAGRHHAEASRVLERRFRYWLPHEARAASEAADRGAPLSMAAGRSALCKAIGRIARDLIGEFEPVQKKPGMVRH